MTLIMISEMLKWVGGGEYLTVLKKCLPRFRTPFLLEADLGNCLFLSSNPVVLLRVVNHVFCSSGYGGMMNMSMKPNWGEQWTLGAFKH